MSQEFFRSFDPTLRPRENVSIEAYNNALLQLQNFAQADIQKMTTLEALVEGTREVGPALRAVALTNGRFGLIYPTRVGDYRFVQSDRTRSLTLTVGRRVFDTQEYAEISFEDLKSVSVFKDGYSIVIPADTIAATIGNSQTQLAVHASQKISRRRKETLTFWYPLCHEQDVLGYAEVLHRGVTDVLSFGLPSPTQIPDGIRDSFNE